eukprot:TRINITY_DN22242_c0_g1_i1.p1 TRINITY_DN22242_c0_g1~~TRINITY_DN22242_c0_g1_i1.p1  ORF type:complete len:169 (-),score=35.33 TRINITY_DN22242_c0_g1_i1:63-569(-)
MLRQATRDLNKLLLTFNPKKGPSWTYNFWLIGPILGFFGMTYGYIRTSSRSAAFGAFDARLINERSTLRHEVHALEHENEELRNRLSKYEKVEKRSSHGHGDHSGSSHAEAGDEFLEQPNIPIAGLQVDSHQMNKPIKAGSRPTSQKSDRVNPEEKGHGKKKHARDSH